MTSKHERMAGRCCTSTHQPLYIFTARNRHYWQRLNLFPYPPLSFTPDPPELTESVLTGTGLRLR
ncbi:hypothetical protein KCP77_20740 [Salmonella enterica subsp. enterica]|nr:hypothetical protein KCP77_20740 [Salmonella enterica subsp. enterica]